MRKTVLCGCLVTFAILSACHGSSSSPDGPQSPSLGIQLPSCGTKTTFFTTLPFTPSLIAGWVPLGNLNPPMHVYPTDHQYMYLKSFLAGDRQPVSLYAPGDVSILSVIVSTTNGGSTKDYTVIFSPCAEVRGEYGHVSTVAPEILAQLAPLDQTCQMNTPSPGVVTTQCYSKQANIPVHAGDIIGTAAGGDADLYDTRITPLVFANSSRYMANTDKFDRFHAVAMSDYYIEPARSTLQALAAPIHQASSQH